MRGLCCSGARDEEYEVADSYAALNPEDSLWRRHFWER